MKASLYSHCAGSERIPSHILDDVLAAVAAIDVRFERGAAPRIRDHFVGTLRSKGWSSEVTVARGSDMSITSMREDIGLCLQTGNMARMYADLIKLQTLYLNDAIQGAIFVLPSQPVALAIPAGPHAAILRLLRRPEQSVSKCLPLAPQFQTMAKQSNWIALEQDAKVRT